MKLHLGNLPQALKKDREAIRLCIEAFGQVVEVREILLFGSFARGDSGPDSDVDLCIVADDAIRQLETARRLRRSIREVRPKPAFTLIPITPKRLEEKRKINDHFFKTVLEEGVVVASAD